jgi:hypothetical protein
MNGDLLASFNEREDVFVLNGVGGRGLGISASPGGLRIKRMRWEREDMKI